MGGGIKTVVRVPYSLVRRLCHDLTCRSLHSKPTLSHTSPFSSHRKDIRTCDTIRGAFLDEYQHRHSAPEPSHPSLPNPFANHVFLFHYLSPPPLLCTTTRAVHPHTPTCLRWHATQLNEVTPHHTWYFEITWIILLKSHRSRYTLLGSYGFPKDTSVIKRLSVPHRARNALTPKFVTPIAFV